VSVETLGRIGLLLGVTGGGIGGGGLVGEAVLGVNEIEGFEERVSGCSGRLFTGGPLVGIGGPLGIGGAKPVGAGGFFFSFGGGRAGAVMEDVGAAEVGVDVVVDVEVEAEVETEVEGGVVEDGSDLGTCLVTTEGRETEVSEESRSGCVFKSLDL